MPKKIVENIEKVIVGKHKAVTQAVVSLISGGHLLIEDVPGVGKTMLAKAISFSINAEYKRIQFTPDILPSDVTGANVFDQKKSEFNFRRGPIFTNVLLADEINRGTPRAQASLLESMEEKQVSIEGTTYPLPKLFFVVATQNPIELHGTYPLPEAQLDRFFMKIDMGYPETKDEVAIMKSHEFQEPLDSVKTVCHMDDILKLRHKAKGIHLDESLLYYIAKITEATREHKEVQLGASPRGALALRRAAQVSAMLEDNDFVKPDHIKEMAYPVLRHRLILEPQARLTGIQPDAIIKEVLNLVEVPVS